MNASLIIFAEYWSLKRLALFCIGGRVRHSVSSSVVFTLIKGTISATRTLFLFTSEEAIN